MHCPDGDSGTYGTEAERRRQEGVSRLFVGATLRRRPTRRFRQFGIRRSNGRRMSGQPALSSPVGSRASRDRDKQEAAPHGPSHAMHTPCAGFSKTGAWYRVPGPGYLAPGTWYPAPEPNRRRRPDTEHRGPSPVTGKRAHRVCMAMHSIAMLCNRLGRMAPLGEDPFRPVGVGVRWHFPRPSLQVFARRTVRRGHLMKVISGQPRSPLTRDSDGL